MIKVLRINPDNVIDLQIDGAKVVSISDAEKVEILPSVFASCGFSGPNHERYSRIAFEAPISIRIERVKAPVFGSSS